MAKKPTTFNGARRAGLSFRAFADAGFSTELLPIMPAGAELNPKSRVDPKSRGKTPGRFDPGYGDWCGFGGWAAPAFKATAADIAEWDSWREPASIGIQNRHVPAFDIDVDHDVIAEALEDAISARFGFAPVRDRGTARRAIFYRAKVPFASAVLRFTLAGQTHQVELRGRGQQTVVEGVHPSGAEYAWRGLGLDVAGARGLQLIDGTEARAFMETELRALIEGLGATDINVVGQASAGDGERFSIGHASLLAADTADAVAALQAIPCEDLDYESWIATMHAFRAAVGGDDEYLEPFLEWCEGYPDADIELAESKWHGISDSAIGADWLFGAAREHGFNHAAVDFAGLDLRDDEPETLVEQYGSEISAMPRDSDARTVRKLIRQMMESRLEQADTERLLERIRKRTGIRASTLRSMAAEARAAVAPAVSIDIGLAVRDKVLAEKFADGRHLVAVGDGQFYRFTGTHWRPESRAFVESQVEAVLETLDGLADEPRDADTITRRATNHLRRAVVRAAADNPFAAIRPAPIVNCANGEIHLNDDGTHELRPHDPGSWLTACLPIQFDPDARCPLFEEFLEEIARPADSDGVLIPLDRMTDADRIAWQNMQRHLVELIGYWIQPRRFIKSFFLLWGRGSNGKSALISIVQALIGIDACMTVQLGKFSRSAFAVGHLGGKLLLCDDDLKRGVTLDDSLVKTLSEGKILTGELKGRDAAPYVNAAVLVLLSNHLPELTDTSAGMVDRMNAIPFHARFEPGANRTGQEKAAAILRDELPGVLNLALGGLHRLVKRGCFDQPEACQALARRWLDEANPLGWFWRECVEATGQEADRLEMETARESYNGFVTMHGLGHAALSQALFGKRVREEFNPRIAQLKVSTLIGYRLRNETTINEFEAAGVR